MMKKRIKNIILSLAVCSFAAALVGAGSKATLTPVKANDTQYFISESNISVAENMSDTAGKTGVDVTLSGVKGQDYVSFEYQNYIQTDSLKNGFFSLSMKPETDGVNDFQYMLVTLTDALDENSKLVWALAPQPKASWWPDFVSVWVSFTDNLARDTEPNYSNEAVLKIKDTSQRAVAINTFIASVNNKYTGYYQDCGYYFGAKNDYFIQKAESSSLTTMTFSYVDTKMQINGRTVAELSDTRFYTAATDKIGGTEYEDLYTFDYVENLFSSGYAKLKVTYMDVNSDSVTCNISKIGEQEFSKNEGCAVKASSPLIITDYITNGIVGYEYALPEVYSLDLIDGELSERIQTTVISPSGVSVPVENNGFYMSEEGVYTVKYSVENKRGDIFEKEYTFVCYKDVPLTEFGNSMNIKSDYVVGDSVMLLNTLGKNSLSTEIDSSVLVETIIQVDGKVVEVLKDADSLKYTFENEGLYAVVFRYRNAFGGIDSTFSRFNVARAIRIIPQKLPVSFQANKKISLADFQVENYVNEVAEKDIYRAIYVNDSLVFMAKGDEVISGELSIPANLLTEKGLATLSYKAGFSKENLSFFKTYEIPVIAPKYFSDYIISYDLDGEYNGAGVTASDTDSGVLFTTEQDKGFMLPQAIVDNKTNIKFSISALAEFEKFQVVLADYANPNKTLTFNLVKNGSNIFNLTVVGKTTSVSAALSKGFLSFGWLFDSNAKILKNELKEALTSTITTWDDGTAFNGFEKGAYLLKYQFVGVKNASALRIEQVANQVFNSTIIAGTVLPIADTQAPLIAYEQTMQAQKVKYGTYFTVSAATAYDVLDSEGVVKVSVETPNGEYLYKDVLCDKSFNVLAEIYGKYVVTYTAVDSSGLFRTRQIYTFAVSDFYNPTISVLGTLPEEVSAGDTLTLPKGIAVDNVTQDMTCWIIAVLPDGERRVINAEWSDEANTWVILENVTFTFEEIGEFRIIYYACDEYYNFVEVEYIIVVK